MIKISGSIDNKTMIKIVDRKQGLIYKPVRLRDLLTNDSWGCLETKTNKQDYLTTSFKDWRQDCDFDNCDITIYNEGEIEEEINDEYYKL